MSDPKVKPSLLTPQVVADIKEAFLKNRCEHGKRMVSAPELRRLHRGHKWWPYESVRVQS